MNGIDEQFCSYKDIVQAQATRLGMKLPDGEKWVSRREVHGMARCQHVRTRV